ncbi:hypothetical protein POTOM_061194 [Populus tomentosa]|uniref:Lipoyl-binding domain-containing protein n=1 Tax=Populus tomentosa TaxID=118781 RepID=A0A8X8C1D9_POPTO|nr:hypothetical protein POTOM_061194 [Populus tomentosa]
MASRLLWASRAASYLRISVSHRGFASVIKDLKYAESHEWVKVAGILLPLVITDHAQDHLVESVKATSDVYSPVSGNVVEVNEELSNSPGLITETSYLAVLFNQLQILDCIGSGHSSPYEKGWIMKVEIKMPVN